MRQSLGIAAILLLVGLFYLNVGQSYRYGRLEREVGKLEQEQLRMVEENKKAIAWLTVLRSPARIAEIAKTELGLSRPRPEDILVVRMPGGE